MKDVAADIYTELFPYIMRFVAIPLIVVTLLYGLISQDSQKAGEFYFSAIKFISAPVVHSLTAPLRDLPLKTQNLLNAPK